MKTHLPPLCCVSLGLIALLSPVSAEEGAKLAGSATAKPYVLFMGADLAVQRDKKFHRVEDVVGSDFKIKIGKKEFFVPTRNRATGLKVSHSLKLTGAAVQLDGLQGGPAYTPANDPARKMIAASGSAGGASAMQDLAQGRVMQLQAEVAHATTVAEAYPGIPEAREALEKFQGYLDEAERKASVLGQSHMWDSQNNPGAQADKMQGEFAEGNHDAMEVSFKISSPVVLDDPHMVVLFKFQDPMAKPGEEGLLIHAESLEPIGPKPKYIRIRQGGLPQGFKYLDSEVHIFNRGEEVATNASSKRVELTREEAQQYLVIEHLTANKGATVPAAAVPGTLSPDRLKALSLDQMNRTYYAKVGPDGTVLGLYADESCHLLIDDATTFAAVNAAFFKPALVKGRPVEGVARVRLGEI